MQSKNISQPNESSTRSKIICSFLFPFFAIFPLLSLISYDWHSIASLCIPPVTPSTNLIGSLGDAFAFYGYQFVGLAIWSVPILSILLGLRYIFSSGAKSTRRATVIVWSTIAFIALTCLLQLTSPLPIIHKILHSLNIVPNAGGVVGYLIITKLLAPLISPFGAAMVMISILLFSLLVIIGFRRILGGIAAIFSWAADKRTPIQDTIEIPQPEKKEETLIPEPKPARVKTPPVKELPKDDLFSTQQAQPKKEEIPHKVEPSNIFADDLFSNSGDDWMSRPREEPKVKRQRAPRSVMPKEAPPPPPQVNTPQAPVQQAPHQINPVPANDSDTQTDYILPPHDILSDIPQSQADHGDIEQMKERLVETLKVFDIDVTIPYTVTGPVVTQYAIQPAPGIRYSSIQSLYPNLQGALMAKSLRIQAPIPGQNAVGIEVPNLTAASVSFREILECDLWKKNAEWPYSGLPKFKVPLLLGKDAAGNDLVVDLSEMPHMLVAGATGQGKSVCLNSIINGLIMSRTPEQLRLIMVDPKRVEFTSYSRLPHLLVPIVNESKKVVFALRWAVNEMERRLKMFSRVGCRNIIDFNTRRTITQQGLPGLGDDELLGTDSEEATIPYIVIIIDELADVMQTEGRDVEAVLARLLALARATGIHLILATQRPDTKVITGTLKSNIPGRIAFKTSQGNDSRTILDSVGAEQLIGKGDMLFKSKDGILLRAQGSFISNEDINAITDYLAQHYPTNFDEKFLRKIEKIKEDDVEEDDDIDTGDTQVLKHAELKNIEREDRYKEALEIVARSGRASTSHLQRVMNMGYNAAARIIDRMEAEGIVGPQKAAGPRDILIDPDEIMRLVNEEEINVVTGVEPPSDDSANSELDSNVDDYHVEPEENIDDDSNGFSETGGTF
jgi:S-DNA-T family DNA segregation ATPase FtsK/SpoIIIE